MGAPLEVVSALELAADEEDELGVSSLFEAAGAEVLEQGCSRAACDLVWGHAEFDQAGARGERGRATQRESRCRRVLGVASSRSDSVAVLPCWLHSPCATLGHSLEPRLGVTVPHRRKHLAQQVSTLPGHARLDSHSHHTEPCTK